MVCKLRLWSVNATLVATVTSDTYINCKYLTWSDNGVGLRFMLHLGCFLFSAGTEHADRHVWLHFYKSACSSMHLSGHAGVTVSSLKNGVSENVVVAGLEDGSIMLWESLDLAPIIKLSDPRFTAPVVSVRFTDATTIITGTQGERLKMHCANVGMWLCWHFVCALAGVGCGKQERWQHAPTN